MALPSLVLALVAVHLFLVRRYGIAPARTRVGVEPERAGFFYPHQFVRDSAAVLVAAAAVLALARFAGAPLEPKADPRVTNYVPSPDWYFLGLQELLRIFQGRSQILGTLVLPSLGAAALFLVPILDRSPERSLRRRPLAAASFLLAAAGVTALTAGGALSVRRERLALARRAVETGEAGGDLPLELSSPVVVTGMNVVTSLRCQKCHSFGNETKEDVPAFGFEGSRVHREWLYEYLRSPVPIRWKQPHVRPPVRMPDFHMTDAETASAAEYLLTLRDEAVVPPQALPALPRDGIAASRGERLFRTLKCSGCHQIGDTGEEVGPDLTRAGRRLRPEFMAAMIRNPQSIVPGTVMKVPPIEDREVADLVAYLESQR